MVSGIQKFREYFSDYKNQYVLIGGAACDINMDDVDSSFRATKDLDIVLITEALSESFGEKFWEFIKEGGYENRKKSNGTPQFYRFDKPVNKEFPYMLELFARNEFIKEGETRCVPLHIGEELSSLSAILLNEDYYKMLVDGRKEVDNLIVLSPAYLIPFKVKAWLDLMERRKAGQEVDSKDIKKHKKDIVSLASILTGNEEVQMPDKVFADMSEFLGMLEESSLDVKFLKSRNITEEMVVRLLERIYLRQ